MKIFVIGYNKCASSTMHNIFVHNGYKSYHQGCQYKIRKWTDVLDSYDVFLDIAPDINLIDKLHKKYKDSLYILNTRPLNKWLISRAEHGVRGYIKNGKHAFFPLSEKLITSWTNSRNNHNMDILKYFMDTPDKLIVLNIDNKNWIDFLTNKLKLKNKNIESKNIHNSSKYNNEIKELIKQTFNKLKYKKEQMEALISSNNFNTYYYIKLYINNLNNDRLLT